MYWRWNHTFKGEQVRKVILAATMVAICVNVGNAYYNCANTVNTKGEMCGILREAYKSTLEQCKYCGKTADCNRAMAAQAI